MSATLRCGWQASCPSEGDRGRRSITFGPCRPYPIVRVIERDEARLALASRALDIPIVLADRAGDVVSLRELTECVWCGLVVAPGT